MPEFGPPLMPECEHTKPLTGPVTITTTTAPSCPFCERDHLRAENEKFRAIESAVNAALNRAGIYCAITFAEAIDQVAAERDELRELVRDTLFYLTRSNLAADVNPALMERLRAVEKAVG